MKKLDKFTAGFIAEMRIYYRLVGQGVYDVIIKDGTEEKVLTVGANYRMAKYEVEDLRKRYIRNLTA